MPLLVGDVAIAPGQESWSLRPRERNRFGLRRLGGVDACGVDAQCGVVCFCRVVGASEE